MGRQRTKTKGFYTLKSRNKEICEHHHHWGVKTVWITDQLQVTVADLTVLELFVAVCPGHCSQSCNGIRNYGLDQTWRTGLRPPWVWVTTHFPAPSVVKPPLPPIPSFHCSSGDFTPLNCPPGLDLDYLPPVLLLLWFGPGEAPAFLCGHERNFKVSFFESLSGL